MIDPRATSDNRVFIDAAAQPVAYRRSVIHVSAPSGAHDWLNRRLIVGMLQPLKPQRQAVLIRAFAVG